MAKGPFKLKSGNSPLFKHMGSSPMREVVPTESLNPEEEVHTSPIGEAIKQLYSKVKTKVGDVKSEIKQKLTSSKSKQPPKLKMKDLPFGSEQRVAEYERRGWAHDPTTTGHTDYIKPDLKPIDDKPKVEKSVSVPDVKINPDLQKAGTEATKTTKYDTSKTAREKHYDAMNVKEQEALSTGKSRKKSKKTLKESYKRGTISKEAYKAGKKKIHKAATKEYRGKSAKEKIAERKN